MDLCVDKFNQQGGLKVGGNTYIVTLIHEDSGGEDPGASTSATRKLIYQDNVNIVMGSIVESAGAAIQKVTKDAGVLHVLTYSTIPTPYAWGVGPDEPLMFLACQTTCRGYGTMFDYLKQNYPNVKGVVHSENLFPHEPLMELAKDLYEERGIQVVGMERFDPTVADYYPWAAACLTHNPDAVSVDHSGPAQMGKQVKALREQGFKGPIISLAPISPVFILQGGGAENCYDIICQAAYADAPGVPATLKEVVDRWKVKYPNEVYADDALHGWNIVLVTFEAIQKAKSLDPEAIMQAVESMNRPGDVQVAEGDAYFGGKQTIGANRELVKTQAISVIQGNDIKNVKWFLADLP
jgi:ABC-type branched-subunit amino acid transport system substrate-binding protein